jgi:integrase
MGIPLDSRDAGVAGALAGYAKVFRDSAPPELQRPAWPARHTRLLIKAALAHWRGLVDPGFEQWHHFVTDAMHVIFAYVTFCRGDSTGQVRLGDLDFDECGMTATIHKQKRPKRYVPIQRHPYREPPLECPIRLLQHYVQSRRSRGAGAQSLAFGRRMQSKHSTTLDTAVKNVVTFLHLPQGPSPFTGHSIRIGVISDAFAIGVPLQTCAAQAGHESSDTTADYIRHDADPGSDGMFLLGHLLPVALRPKTASSV